MNQVTNVSELTDVQPTDWAFQALQSLVERYGVIVGYPDRTFRGDRVMTRYEFAAALNAFLERSNQLIAQGGISQFEPEDLATLQQLQTAYTSALRNLRDRLDELETRSAVLETNQVSTTTKLQGQTIVAFTNGSNTNTTVVSRTRLNFLTSFQGRDLLFTQLEAGNAGADTFSVQNQGPNLLGTAGLLADGGGLDYAQVDKTVRLNKLYYTFRPRTDLSVTIGPRMLPRDFIDRNSFANEPAVDFNSSFFINNPLIVQNQIDQFGGAGAALNWNFGGGPLTLRSLYIAADASQINRGLFSDRYQGSAELEYSPNKALAVRLQYTNAAINNIDINTFGINAEWAFNSSTAIFGRYGFGTYSGFNPALARDLELHPQTWSVGLAFRNLLIPGSLAGLAVGQPFVESGIGNATQTNFEAFYNLFLSDNISITPDVMVMTNANNDRSNSTVWQSTLRTVFSF
jgi:hypothetical protein